MDKKKKEKQMSHDRKYNLEQIKEKLIDKTIIGTIEDPESDGFGFIAEHRILGTRYEVWVQRDAENNGCGWLEIEKPNAEK